MEVGTVVAYISEGAPAASTQAASAAEPDAPRATQPGTSSAAAPLVTPPPSPQATPLPPVSAPSRGFEQATASDGDSGEAACTATSEERLRTRSTPVVRRIAQEAGVDISAIPGTGATRAGSPSRTSSPSSSAVVLRNQPRLPLRLPLRHRMSRHPKPPPPHRYQPSRLRPRSAPPRLRACTPWRPPARAPQLHPTSGSASTSRSSTRCSRFAKATAWRR